MTKNASNSASESNSELDGKDVRILGIENLSEARSALFAVEQFLKDGYKKEGWSAGCAYMPHNEKKPGFYVYRTKNSITAKKMGIRGEVKDPRKEESDG